MWQVGPDDTLKSVIKALLHYRVATLPVLYMPADNWALPQLLHLASLSGVLKCKTKRLIFLDSCSRNI